MHDPAKTRISLTTEDFRRLFELVESVAKAEGLSGSEAIARLETLADHRKVSLKAGLVQFVDRVRRLRLRRNSLIGAPLFRDPAWDMMLALFSAHERGQQESITSLCYASGVPLTTALRQIGRLEEHGMITRNGDGSDMRRSWVAPTPKAVSGISDIATLFQREALAARAEYDDEESPVSLIPQPTPSTQS